MPHTMEETPYKELQTAVLTLRPATPEDVPDILAFIRDLAEYEREPDAVLATEADLLRDGFTEPRRFQSLIAEWNGQPAGFALYFYSYSTWQGRAGIYLEDLFVRPELRGKGIGKAILAKVAAIAVAEGLPRFEWSVLDWNQPSIDFYHQMGAVMKSEWLGMRVTGEALTNLAALSVTELVRL
jgi:GNAT superfamily N-acetyltransferase